MRSSRGSKTCNCRPRPRREAVGSSEATRPGWCAPSSPASLTAAEAAASIASALRQGAGQERHAARQGGRGRAEEARAGWGVDE